MSWQPPTSNSSDYQSDENHSAEDKPEPTKMEDGTCVFASQAEADEYAEKHGGSVNAVGNVFTVKA